MSARPNPTGRIPQSPKRTRSTRLANPSSHTLISSSPLYPTQYPLPHRSSSASRNDSNNCYNTKAASTSSPLGSGGSQLPISQENQISQTSTYKPPKLKTFKQRQQEKERQAALAAGREWHDPDTPRLDDVPTESSRLASQSGTTGLSDRSTHPASIGNIRLPQVGVPLGPENVGLSESHSVKPLPRPLPLPAVPHARSGSDAQTDSSASTSTSSPLSRPSQTAAVLSSSRTRPLPKPTHSSRASPLDSIPEPRAVSNISSPRTLATKPSATSISAVSPKDYVSDWSPRPTDQVERSDTISSVKSLDRYGMTASGERPLPRPPIGVGPSRSLDRGVPPVASALSKQPSMPAISPTPNPPSNSATPLPQTGQSGGLVHESYVPVTPTKQRVEAGPTVPTLVLTSDDTDEKPDRAEPVTTSSPGRATYSSIPKIQVETSDTLPPVIPTINIPTICFPDEQDDDPPADGSDQNATMPTRPTLNVETSPPKATSSSHTPIRSATPQSVTTTTTASSSTQPQGPGIFCSRCDGVIIGRIVSAMNKRWHPACFQCSVCRTMLEHVSSYEHEGKAYCHMDYHDQFAPKCHYCETAIVESRFITIDDPSLGHRYYHELHFFCGECGDPFLDPSKSSAAGTEFERASKKAKLAVQGGAAEADDEDDVQTKDFIIHGRHAFCVECHAKLYKPKCSGCKKPIRDTALGAMGGKWHKGCFCCVECDKPFPGGAFFPIDGQPFCQTCYTSSLTA